MLFNQILKFNGIICESKAKQRMVSKGRSMDPSDSRSCQRGAFRFGSFDFGGHFRQLVDPWRLEQDGPKTSGRTFTCIFFCGIVRMHFLHAISIVGPLCLTQVPLNWLPSTWWRWDHVPHGIISKNLFRSYTSTTLFQNQSTEWHGLAATLTTHHVLQASS